jgi:hypothetical protein
MRQPPEAPPPKRAHLTHSSLTHDPRCGRRFEDDDVAGDLCVAASAIRGNKLQYTAVSRTHRIPRRRLEDDLAGDLCVAAVITNFIVS